MSELQSRIEILITTIKKGMGDKETKKTLKDLGAGFKEVTGISLGWVGAIGIASAGLAKFEEVAQQSISDVVGLANSTEHLQRITGDNAETMSRFIQVADDARIEIGDLESALQMAANKGIAVNTNALMAMSDEYMKLAPGVERNTYVSERFGKQSKEITKLLEMGSAEIKARMLTTSDSITVDNRAVAASKEYQESLDALNDSALGLRMNIGKQLIPVLSDFALVASDGIEQSDSWINKWSQISRVINGFMTLGLSEAMRGGTNAISDQADAIRAEEEETRKSIIAQQIFISDARENKDILDTGLNPMLDSATEKYGSLGMREEDAALFAENFKDKTLEAKDATNDANSAMEKYSSQLLFNKASATMSADEALKLAYKMGMVDDATVLATTKQKEWKQMLDDGKITQEQYNALIAGMKTRIDELQSKNVTVNVDTYYNEHRGGGSGGAGSGGTGGGSGAMESRAVGGPVSAGQVVMVGEKGPEPVVFGQDGYVLPTGTSLGNTIYLTVSGAGDPRAVANEVMRQLGLQGVRR